MSWNIFYIDDSHSELTSVAAALGRDGHKVATRPGPYDCDEPLATADLVIIDYHLGGTNGRETLELLRERVAGTDRNPRFFLYTSDTEVGADYRALGFDGRFILKGNTDALRRQVDAAMRIEALRQLRPQKT
jgi:CheY-like chemotaxis protein